MIPQIFLVEGTKVKLAVKPVRRIGGNQDGKDYEVRMQGPGRSVPLYRISFSPSRGGWYYFSLSTNPGAQVNSLSTAEATMEAALNRVIALATEVVRNHCKGGAA